jgi:hypothetical protein
MTRKTKAEQIAEEIRAEEERALDAVHAPAPRRPDFDPSVSYAAVCRTPCTFNGRYWGKGEEYRDYPKPPEHFEIIEVLSGGENETAGAGDESPAKKKG